ncbi:MAG TPA: adenylate/guanylate cyclase domain-containing protein [Leptospiraceae bacterium]|nr:adenylate/guanylate cyclase domain-containing protein [Leptospiraceae bacterium]HNF12541.1 adenylate/guanylate cyclase domain-containing protein [Leptospiraceae bacterium]HNI96111.1 adenylate/guanylate cyclase domain-containing protein [Leptospiraceae bacterium]HNM05808.1 adenylate/guanylate cyclase domain-containing protein [Leptospiraceae bacterium]HNN07088.1 adenylate/guanylate cyclase domain-containing protein [Leptospiraceae bacterium]
MDIRIGLHTGPLMAGIIGEHDIWGDTVNIALRMESADEIGCIKLSAAMASSAADSFHIRSCGIQNVRGFGDTEMFELIS